MVWSKKWQADVYCTKMNPEINFQWTEDQKIISTTIIIGGNNLFSLRIIRHRIPRIYCKTSSIVSGSNSIVIKSRDNGSKYVLSQVNPSICTIEDFLNTSLLREVGNQGSTQTEFSRRKPKHLNFFYDVILLQLVRHRIYRRLFAFSFYSATVINF